MSQFSTPAVTDAIYDASSLGRPRMFPLGLHMRVDAIFNASVSSGCRAPCAGQFGQSDCRG